MTNLLTEESPQVYHPTLATWIGINEAMFLAQLNFILTKNESVGKFADGRKWYRDKPRDFVVKYFPFWDEGIVKRVIDNLRADEILLARSDLNKDPKDRSLWYTISYEAIERLAGPLERITNKSQKRKQARAARKSKEDNNSEYTKVQNVLLNDSKPELTETEPEAIEVQNVPTEDISTNCTFDPGTNCTLPSVQNVLTPKDSLSKTPLPKEFAPKKIASPEQNKLFLILAGLCRIELKVATDKQIGQLDQAAKALVKTVKDSDQFKEKFGIYWLTVDWRGKQDQPPTPAQVREVYGDYCHWLEHGQQNGAKQNGHQRTYKTRQDGHAIKPRPMDETTIREVESEIAELERQLQIRGNLAGAAS